MVIVPHTFQNKEGKIKLQEIDENFAALVSALKVSSNGQIYSVIGASGATGP